MKVWNLLAYWSAARPLRPPASFDPPALPVDPAIYSNLYTYAHLADISYCISKNRRISSPFKCDLNCEQRFPNVTLVHQWYDDDTACGYIATTYSNIFHYDEQESGSPKKTIIVSLRGTRSVFDGYTDLKMDMINYYNLRYHIKPCGENCKVHKGFFEAFISSLNNIHEVLENEIDTDNYEILLVGHSMGGSIALLLGLHMLDLGYSKLSLVTFGSPLVGNEPFVRWTDEVMGSFYSPQHNSYKRKFLRVIHKDDIVTTIPKSKNILDRYHQFDNQIYLNCSASDARPSPEMVVDCISGDNSQCIAQDFPDSFDVEGGISRNYYTAHNTYLRSMGLCGIGITD